MFCPKCGTELAEDVTTCTNCQATVSEVQKDMQQISDAKYKEAKNAYKHAKKDAGKSSAPKVILIVVLVIVLVAAAAAAVWWYRGQDVKEANQEIATLREANTALTKELEATKAKLAEYEAGAANLEELAKAMVGTWKVSTFDSTTTSFACYGGKKGADQVSVTISYNEQTQELTSEISFVYHGHARPLKEDVQSDSGDKVIVKQQLADVLTADGLIYTLDMSNEYGANSAAIITLKLKSAEGTDLIMTADSFYKTTTDSITDTYTLKKVS